MEKEPNKSIVSTEPDCKIPQTEISNLYEFIDDFNVKNPV